jgi:hypothetical protein
MNTNLVEQRLIEKYVNFHLRELSKLKISSTFYINEKINSN